MLCMANWPAMAANQRQSPSVSVSRSQRWRRQFVGRLMNDAPGLHNALISKALKVVALAVHRRAVCDFLEMSLNLLPLLFCSFKWCFKDPNLSIAAFVIVSLFILQFSTKCWKTYLNYYPGLFALKPFSWHPFSGKLAFSWPPSCRDIINNCGYFVA